MNPTEGQTDEQRVKAVYEYASAWRGWGEDGPISIWSGLKDQSERLSKGQATVDRAWADAASRIAPAPIAAPAETGDDSNWPSHCEIKSVAPIAAEEERATKSESRNNSGAIIPDSCAISPQHRGEKEAPLPTREAVEAALQNTEYAKGHILHHLAMMGEGERRTLFRAVLVASKAESNPGEEGGE